MVKATMSDHLLVPIAIEALSLPVNTAVVEASADFTRLQYCSGTRDVNPDIGYISEEIVSQPFQNKNLYLKAGVHLHWFLPSALTKGTVDSDKNLFPKVPNRWLVTRYQSPEKEQWIVEKQWVVESDYLHPEGSRDDVVVIPLLAQGASSPYRRMGRKMTLEDWLKSGDSPEADYLDKFNGGVGLTAVGYGAPTFAAFYPNCHSVFGFYDDEFQDSFPDGLKYTVIGWYSDACDDFLRKYLESATQGNHGNGGKIHNSLFQKLFDSLMRQLLDELTPRIDTKKQELVEMAVTDTLRQKLIDTPLQTLADTLIRQLGEVLKPDDLTGLLKNKIVDSMRMGFINALKQDFDWDLKTLDEEFPRRMFCYGIVSKPTSDFKFEYNGKIATANSGVEALSAYLAGEIARDNDKQKALIEEQLEFLSVRRQLANRRLDLDAKFLENRHERGFNAVFGGFRWLIRTKITPVKSTDPRKDKPKTELPNKFADDLGKLNLLQGEYDKNRHEIIDSRRQLFSDWYKYMLCMYPPEGAFDDYPDIDLVKYFIDTQGIAPLIDKVGNNNQKGKELGDKILELEYSIKKHNEEEGADPLELKKVPSSRYWKPKEPVVLIEDDAKSVLFKSREGPSECISVKRIIDDAHIQKDTLDFLLDEIPSVSGKPDKDVLKSWPLFLEWEVLYSPVSDGADVYSPYREDYITVNFELKENEAELRKKDKETEGRSNKSIQIYCGRSILTPHAGIQLKKRIVDYLRVLCDPEGLKELPGISEKNGIKAWYDSRTKYRPDPANDETFEEWLTKNHDKINEWYETRPKSDIAKTVQEWQDPIVTFLNAFKLMQGKAFISQTLSGFNDALLMHKQTMQLPIADPIGFPGYREFAGRVEAAVAGENRIAPQPLDDFNPIRTGTMEILHLRLVDTFGRSYELPVKEVIVTELMRIHENGRNLVMLPPRLVQPARVNFRWLSADPAFKPEDGKSHAETNAHPATHPICGWLLLNFLDGSIMVYNRSGNALGTITDDVDSSWRPAPRSKTDKVEKIEDTHLKNVVEYIIGTTHGGFMDTLEEAIETVAPHGPGGDMGVALLVGRPIAVVRAVLELQLQGHPAVHQGWNTFRRDLVSTVRNTSAFEYVRFPVRLGEKMQLNDGLIGYWPEDKDQKLTTFHSAGDNPNTIELSANENSLTLTMLMDPHGKVHATSGILPVKAIDIPPDQYSDLLKKLEVTFSAAPILSDKTTSKDTNQIPVNIPVPVEAGYGWTWVGGDTTKPDRVINQPNPGEAFAAPQEILEGWLKLKPHSNENNSKE